MATPNQKPTRRPAFVTQRDGSPLANSNCRMASIAMGLDYDTGGSKTSTGAKMRTYTSDQSGGTDSGDAREAWDRGYDESLTIRDGSTWSDALADLKAGRVVHLDVWHASVGGPCLSGSGGYGHTIAVIPDCQDGAWAVGDPWCTDGYHRVSESKLKAGAEAWGGEVYGLAAAEADWPTAGPDLRARIVARIVKRLMDRWHPGNPLGILTQPDTGGGQSILYTVTVARPLQGADDMLDQLHGGAGRLYHYPTRDFYDKPGGTKLGDLGDGVYRVVATLEDESGQIWYMIDGGGTGIMRWVKA